MNKNVVIFDLDGTIADIEDRRKLSTKPDGKINWSKFFDPQNVSLDKPVHAVIANVQALKAAGYKIIILSKYNVPFDFIRMRPINHRWQFIADDKLKKEWLDEMFPDNNKDHILCVFDDRDKVVKMWRENGLNCFQVAPGNF